MKKIILLFAVLCYTLSSAQQNLNIELDYTVDYLIPNKKKQQKDTLTIGFDKTGRYLWSNYDGLSDLFTKEIFRTKDIAEKNVQTNVIYDSKTVSLILQVKVKDSYMFFSIKIDDLMPEDASEAFDDAMVLMSSKTGENLELMGNQYPTYSVFPSNKPDDIIEISLDESIPINNNALFKEFIEIMLLKTKSKGKIDLDLPNGLILSIREKDKFELEAIRINKTKKKIQLNHNFQITE